jgi:queuine tRNA-ribosyltransferase
MEFEITKAIPGSLGRAGVIKTAHGQIKTPTFMAVGTHGYVRFLPPSDLHSLGAQAMLSNGFHLRRQSSEIAKAGGLAKWIPGPCQVKEDSSLAWQGPTLTDSGGFQVMSLGSGLGKVVSMEKERGITNTAHKERLAHVTEEGVNFIDPFDGQPDFIGPEESMQIQCRIGADIHMAFDELTSLADTYEYNIEAMHRTERWAKRSLAEHLKHRDDLGYRQNLYAVLQGGRWEDLRRATAKTLSQIQVDGETFDGFGLGGAFLKEDLGEILRWCNEELPANKPRHLLGLSHPDDILIGTEMGADTFDCVAPTREARHGKIYTHRGNLNLRQMRDVSKPLDDHCDCATCRAGWTLGPLRALWRSGDEAQKVKYYNLASIHNLRFIVRLTEDIRAAIIGDYFPEFKRDFLAKYYNQ